MDNSIIMNMLVNNINIYNQSRVVLKPSYFDNEYVKFIYINMNKFYDMYNKLPSSSEEFIAFYTPYLQSYKLLSPDDVASTLRNIYKYSEYDISLVDKSVSNFISSKMVLELLVDIKNCVTSADVINIDDKLSSLVDEYVEKKSFDILSSDKEPIKLSDLDNVNKLITYKSDPGVVIKSSITSLNQSLQYKGYVRGDVGMVIAPPGTGKSTFLISEGAHASSQGFRILHVLIGDMDEGDGIIKYLSNIMSVPQDRLINMTYDDRSEIINLKGSLTDSLSNIDIVSFNPDELDSSQLYDKIIKIQSKSRLHYDMIIVDYPENLRSNPEDSMYSSGDKNYKMLSKLAKDNKSVVLTGSQPKSNYWNHEIIPMDSAAESSKKQHHVDYIFTIGAASISGDSQVNKFNICKVRRGRKSITSVKLLGELSKIIEITDDEYSRVRSEYTNLTTRSYQNKGG